MNSRTNAGDTPPTHDLVIDLVDRVPELAEPFQEHVRDNDELLPYLFLSDVARWVAARFLGGTDSDLELVSETLDFLEEKYEQGPQDVKELIAVGLVESLPSTGEPASAVRDLLGPNLSAQFRLLNW